MNMKGAPIAIPWFGPDDQLLFAELYPDGHPARLCSYEEWMNNTFLDETRLRSDGFTTHRTYVSFVAYKAWLDSKGRELSGDLIGSFAGYVNRKILGLPESIFGEAVFHGDRLPPPKL
jgi:hypothetical protein